MKYHEIDPTLSDWAKKYGLHVFTNYQDSDVRSTDVVDNSGERYQIWIDVSDGPKVLVIHAWDYQERRVQLQCSLSDLRERLDQAYKAVEG